MLVRTSFVVLGKKSFLTDLSIDDQGNFSLFESFLPLRLR